MADSIGCAMPSLHEHPAFHGHRIATMLSVYAARVQGACECDVAAVRRAMDYHDDPQPGASWIESVILYAKQC